MIRRVLAIAGLLLSLPANAQLGTAAPPSLRVVNIRTFCVNNLSPYLQADLVINEEDKGLPGVIYVGTLDDGKQNPHFLGPNGWTAWGSGTIPVYSIMREGLAVPVRPLQQQTVGVTLDLSSLPAMGSQSIYMGYGALSAKSEKAVQGGIDAVVMMRKKFPDRQLPPSVDPDMHRLALVQDDMTRNGKYNFVLSSASIPVCQNN